MKTIPTIALILLLFYACNKTKPFEEHLLIPKDLSPNNISRLLSESREKYDSSENISSLYGYQFKVYPFSTPQKYILTFKHKHKASVNYIEWNSYNQKLHNKGEKLLDWSSYQCKSEEQIQDIQNCYNAITSAWNNSTFNVPQNENIFYICKISSIEKNCNWTLEWYKYDKELFCDILLESYLIKDGVLIENSI